MLWKLNNLTFNMKNTPKIIYFLLIFSFFFTTFSSCTKNVSPQLKQAISTTVSLPTSTPAPPDVKTEKMAVHYRNGQIFITWAENKDLNNETYRVYHSSELITTENLENATLLSTLSEDSARFYTNRYQSAENEKWTERYVRRYVIEDKGKQLPSNTGLLVWTLAPGDMDENDKQAGYYAVTIEPENQEEILEDGYSLGPVLEMINDPLPVELNVNAGTGGHVYIQYMDLHTWNPTFHAPNDTNSYYGYDPETHPTFSKAIQYAYDYAIGEPNPKKCGGTVPAQVPVLVELHGWQGNNLPPYTDGYSNWCAYVIFPLDISNTWWFGFAGERDYRTNKIPSKGDEIVNFTEQRVLRMIYDLMRNPPGPKVDANRIYIYGHSMGGSGALAFALRYPNVFAAAYASKPMTNYLTSGEGGGNNWRNYIRPIWGTEKSNLPVQIRAPADWADALKGYNGTGIWDWQNHQENLVSRKEDEMVPFGVAHSRNDTVIEWDTQGAPAYEAFDDSKHAWAGIITSDEHKGLEFLGMPAAMRMDDSGVPFDSLKVVKNETVPGLSNGSKNLQTPPDTNGGFNQTILWSSSWNPWDGPPVDTSTRWQISLCYTDAGNKMGKCEKGHGQTVDITPRRLQQFKIIPGAKYRWENYKISNNSLMDSGTVTADSKGLLTIKDVAISSNGSRLILEPVTP
jgi:pimeloyl-ACP methyl ester carboxylesterase